MHRFFYSRGRKVCRKLQHGGWLLASSLLVRCLVRFLNPLVGCYSFQNSHVSPSLVFQLMMLLRQHFASEIYWLLTFSSQKASLSASRELLHAIKNLRVCYDC